MPLQVTYLACKRRAIPRSGCNTGKRGTRPGLHTGGKRARARWPIRLSDVPTSKPGGGYLDSLSTAQTVGGTHRGNKQYNTILQSRQHSNIPATQVQRSDSATYQPRAVVRALGFASSVLFPFLPSRFLFYIHRPPLFPRGAARYPLPPPPPSPPVPLARTPLARPHRSHRRVRPSCRLRSIAVPSPFHLVERLYLIGWIINHR